MGTMLKWEKYRNKMRGVYGQSYSPKFNSSDWKPPTGKQIRWVEMMAEYLESKGIPANYLLENTHGGYKLRFADNEEVKRQLKRLFTENKLNTQGMWEFHYEYVNLCKETATGKKIKYRTSRRYSHPVGYEFIGELSSEIVDGGTYL